MTVGTHLIKIKGTFDKKIWGYEDEWVNEIFKEYIKTKIKNEIDSHYNPNLEFVRIDDNKIEVWIYIKALSLNISRDIIEKWLIDHIHEDGIDIYDLEIEKMIFGENYVRT